MATDFGYSSKTIQTTGPIKPGGKNMPADTRTRVNTYADIATIPNPFVGMVVTVLADENTDGTMKDYKVKSLKANALGIADSLIDEVVPYADYLGVASVGGSSSGGASVEIVNDLTTGGANKALSAEQGKVIKSSLDAIETRVDNLVLGNGGFATKTLTTEEITSIIGTTPAPPVDLEVKSITASSNYLSINVGETRQITYTLLPSGATTTVTYESSDSTVCSVDQDGNIEALKAGDILITLTCTNGVKTDCQVVVNEVSQQVDVTSITLNKTNLQLDLNEAITLTATVLPQNATNKSVTWESSNTNIASVINGVVTGINNGTCIITCKSVSDPTITQTCNVTVQEIVALTSITDGLQHSYDFTNLNGDSTSVSDLTGDVPATLTGFSDVTSAKTVYGIVTGADKTGTIIQGNMSSITGKYTIAITFKGLRTNSQGIYSTAGVKFNTINSGTPYFCYTEGGFLQEKIYSPFSENTFINVISVFDYDTNTITTYIDGELVETTATTTKTWTNSITLGTGYWGGANSICFKNMVIYNRCISPTEAKIISSDLMPVKFLGINTQNTSLPLINSLVDHFGCTGTLTDTNLLSLVRDTSLSNVASNSNTDGFVLSSACEIPNTSYINFSCFVKFNYEFTSSSNQSTIISDDGTTTLDVYILNGKLYAKTKSTWLLNSNGVPINLNDTDNVLQISVNRLSNTISFYFDNTFVGEQTNYTINSTVFCLANTDIPVKDIVLYHGILSEVDRTTVYNSLLGIYSTTLLADGDTVTTSTTSSIVGIMEAIVSPNNTSECQVITLPFNVANSVYFGDGKTLQQKFDNGELGSSGTNNKWYGKNIVCLGDSITASGYPTYIGEVLGAFINNQGSSGGTYSRDFDIIQGIDWTYVDAVTYMTGQNSAGGGNITIEDSGLYNVTDWSDYSSYPNNYFGGVAKVINYIRSKNPNIKIYLIGQANSGVLPKENNYAYMIKIKMEALSEFLSVSFIDTFSHAGINYVNWSDYSTDGVHINEEGKKLVGRNAGYEMMYL